MGAKRKAYAGQIERWGSHKCHLTLRFLATGPPESRLVSLSLSLETTLPVLQKVSGRVSKCPYWRNPAASAGPLSYCFIPKALFFPEPRLLADPLVSGNSLIVGVRKQ